MNSYIWIPVAFVGGAIIGGLVGGYFASKECRKRVQQLEEERKEETKEMNEIMAKYHGKLEAKEKDIDKKLAEPMKEKPAKKNQSPRVEDHPFRITEKEFESDYGKVDDETITYYRLDGVLADKTNSVIDNPVELIGKDVWESIDSIEDEAVYVHNESLEMNFEICIEQNLSYYRDVVNG